jgi:hypothetical protein
MAVAAAEGYSVEGVEEQFLVSEERAAAGAPMYMSMTPSTMLLFTERDIFLEACSTTLRKLSALASGTKWVVQWGRVGLETCSM